MLSSLSEKLLSFIYCVTDVTLMSLGPIFQSSSDLATWRKLTGTGTGRFSLSKKSVSPESIADEILGNQVPTDSAILVKLMDTLYDSRSERFATLIPELVSKQRLSDSAPTLEAAMLLHKTGDREGAKNMLGSVGDIQNVPLKSIVRARFLLDEGDMSSAKVVLKRGRCSDPLNTQIYKMLEEADPSGGWMYYRNIELLHAGRKTVACGTADEDTPQKRLYEIYCQWHQGNRDKATGMLVNSPEYLDGDFHFILAAARMSAYEEDWHSSEIIYSKLVDSACVYVLCEAARVSLMEGNENRAFKLYGRAELEDPKSPLVLRELIDANMKIGSRDEAVNKIMILLDSEFADLGTYIRCAETLVSEGLNSQAEPIIRRILLNYPENYEANLLMSRNEMARGNYNVALDAASTAVKAESGERSPRLQRAKVLFDMGRLDKALKDTGYLLKENPEDIEALILTKDIYMAQGKKNKTMDMYDTILELSPDNAQIILEYSKAKMQNGDTEDSLISFRKAIVADPRPANFISVIRLLIDDGMNQEAVDLCKEMDGRYSSVAAVKILRGNAEYALGDYLKASVSFAAAAALNPHSSEAWHSKGMADEAAGDLDSAEDAFNRAVLLNMNLPEYWISKASVQERKKDYSGAVESLNRVIELKPDNVYALVKKGMIFSNVGRYGEALFFLDMAIMVNTWNKDIHGIKKEVCIHTGRYREAIEVCMEILAIDSGNIPAMVDAADCMMRIGDRAKALSFINSKLSRSPNSIPLLLSKKSILTSMGDYPELIKVCYRILEKDPDNRSVKMDLAQALADNGDMVSADRIRMELYDDDATLEPIEEEIEEEPDEPREESDPGSLFNIARSLYSTGDLTGAARLTDRALEADPGNPEFISFRVRIYLESRDMAGALGTIRKGLEKTEDSGRLFELEGDVRAKTEDYGAAAESYLRAIESGNDGHDMYVKRGDILEKSGDIDGAISDYLAAVSKSGSDNTSRVRLASIYVSAGNPEEADRVIQVVLENEPDNYEALAVRAEICSETGDIEGLSEIYERILEQDVTDGEILKKISALLSEHGLQQESSVLSMKAAGESEEDETEVSDETKRLSEKLLRRAYVSKRPFDDPGIINTLDSRESTADKIIAYLSDIREYGPIIPGTPEFDRMESLSHYAVMRAELENIEEEPMIPMSSAFVAGGAKDADEAKALVSYIFEVFNTEVRLDYLSEELTELAFGLDKDASVYELVRDHNLGVYNARAVKELSNLTSETS